MVKKMWRRNVKMCISSTPTAKAKKNADITASGSLKCGYKKAILKIFNVHNFWNEKILHAARRILEVDKKTQTRREDDNREDTEKNKQKATEGA